MTPNNQHPQQQAPESQPQEGEPQGKMLQFVPKPHKELTLGRIVFWMGLCFLGTALLAFMLAELTAMTDDEPQRNRRPSRGPYGRRMRDYGSARDGHDYERERGSNGRLYRYSRASRDEEGDEYDEYDDEYDDERDGHSGRRDAGARTSRRSEGRPSSGSATGTPQVVIHNSPPAGGTTHVGSQGSQGGQ